MLKIEFVSEIQPQKSWPRTSLASRRNLSNPMLFNAGKSTEKQSLSTTSNMDRQLLRQKSRQKFSVKKTKKLVFPEK